MLSRLHICLGLLWALSVTTIEASTGSVSFYDPTPGAVSSSSYKLTVDGKPLIVERFGDVHYARFILNGPADVQVTLEGGKIKRALVSPLSYKIKTRQKGSTLSFTLDRPCGLFIRINGEDPLMIFADFPELNKPDPDGQAVVKLTDYLAADRDPGQPVTAAIQEAIDHTSQLNDGSGGILYIPNGLYVAGQLRLKSNVHLYLESGALLQAQSTFDSKAFPAQANGDSSFIFIEDARNVSISGRGIIDGNGYALRSGNARANVKLLRSAGASDLMIEGVFFRDSARWSLHILDSDRVLIRGIKLVNDLRGKVDPKENVYHALVSNTDGIDIDASRDVIVEGTFLYTCDDAISPKVTNYMGRKGKCARLVIRNNVLWTIKSALKIGDETIEDIGDILFENNYILHADRAVAIWSGDSGRIHNIRVVNNACEFIGGDYNERFFYYRIRMRRPEVTEPGTIEDVLVKDFFALQPASQPSSIEGYDDDHQITGLTFDNIVIKGKRARSKTDIPLRLRGFAAEPVFNPSPKTSE